MSLFPLPSLEVTATDLQQEGNCLARLSGPRQVFVAHLDGQSAEDLVRDCVRVRQLGHAPVPHVAARRYRDFNELGMTLAGLVDRAGVREVLALGGDVEPVGEIRDSLDLLDSGLLEQAPLERVWFAGYPEGHQKIDRKSLEGAWRKKRSWAEHSGICVGVVTQLAMDPAVVSAWVRAQGFEESGVAVRVSRFRWARASVLLDLARVAGLPELARLAQSAGLDGLVRGDFTGEEAVAHCMALGALGRLVGSLREGAQENG